MSIMLGNLTIEQIEKRIGIEFPIETKEFMNESRQENADNVKNGKWHCFDIPFHMVCGDIETATKIYDSVKSRSSEVKERLEFSINKKNGLNHEKI